jgi:hypothetical protein
MKKSIVGVRPVISNIVSTSNLHHKVNVKKFMKFGWGTYDNAIYGGNIMAKNNPTTFVVRLPKNF